MDNRKLDDLFRQALQPLVDAQPPKGGWERVVRELPQQDKVWRPLRWAKLHGLGWSWHLHTGGQLRSWTYGFASVYACFSNQPYFSRSDGKCHPSPFAGVMVKQLWDLRLAS